MKRIGIMSDTHGYRELIDAVVEITADEELDMCLHAGDFGDDARYLQTLIDIPVYAVRGNTDCEQPLEPREQLIPLEDTYIYMTHGHEVSYYNRVQELLYLGRAMGARLVVAGHTHHHRQVEQDGCTFENPGSLALPRDLSGGTFSIVTYDNGHFSVEFCYIQELMK